MTNTQSPAPGVAAEREQFEAWYDAQFIGHAGFANRHGLNESYCTPELENRWKGWLARAALQASAAAVEPVAHTFVAAAPLRARLSDKNHLVYVADPLSSTACRGVFVNDVTAWWWDAGLVYERQSAAADKGLSMRTAPPLPAQVQAAEPKGYEHDRAVMEGNRNEAAEIWQNEMNYTDGELRAFDQGFTSGWDRSASRTPAPGMAGGVGEIGWRDAEYKDSTPLLSVGNSAFEDWFQQQPFATQSGIKQISRDSYAAGMGDPLVTYATPHPSPVQQAAWAVEHRPNCAMGRQARCDCDYQERKAAAGRAGS